VKILIASSEVHPYSKSGGLADMVGALGKSLARAGHEISLVTPLYQGIAERFPELQPTDLQFELPLGPAAVRAGVWKLQPARGLTIYFVDQPGFYQRPGLYQDANRLDYPDNAHRFIFFSKCVVYLARYLHERPELVHSHDWQTGLVPLFITDQKTRSGWANAPRTCITIHNLAYQGHFPGAHYSLTNLPPDYFHPDGAEFYGGLNCLKAGIIYADCITTVSPRYAREITTPEFGCGLDGVLRRRQGVLAGILNGVDYDEWKTVDNPYLETFYTLRDLRGKTANKLSLQQFVGLPAAANVPLFGTISRLVDQKGIDLELGALEEMLSAEMQFILLGTGEAQYERALQNLARRYPTKVAALIAFDQRQSHRVEAGADFFIMPSRFEPCGLNQMYSLRYGTIPIVRMTGGLDDSVIDPSEDPDRANGIKFSELSSRALAKAIRKALVLYSDQRLFERFRKNAMSADFSWERTAREYVKVYRKAL
jgi:starch synthase